MEVCGRVEVRAMHVDGWEHGWSGCVLRSAMCRKLVCQSEHHKIT